LAPELPIHFFVRQSHAVMAAADAVLVTSGTATLETMLFKRPMVIAYRMHPITYRIVKKIIKIKFFGLPNLLANTSLVPEYLQDAAEPDSIAAALLAFLNQPEKSENLVKQFSDIHLQLRQNANNQAADAVQKLLNKSS
jgi:lipid-A-disaccharide synthase